MLLLPETGGFLCDFFRQKLQPPSRESLSMCQVSKLLSQRDSGYTTWFEGRLQGRCIPCERSLCPKIISMRAQFRLSRGTVRKGVGPLVATGLRNVRDPQQELKNVALPRLEWVSEMRP